MKKVTHFRGIPAQWPPIFPRKTNFVRYNVAFGDAARYDIGATEQADWNKLTGLKLSYFHPTRDALIIAWRWHGGKFQLAPYLNKSDKYYYGLQPVIDLLPGREYTVQVGATEDMMVAQVWDGNANLLTYEETWPGQVEGKTWELSSWFGGNTKPPKNVSFFKEREG